MEKDFRFWFHQKPASSPSNLNSLHFPFETSHANAGSVFMNPNSAEDSTPRIAPFLPISRFQQLRESDPDSQNVLSSVLNIYQTFDPIDFGGTAHNEKRFVVFDQSGDKTTLIYSSQVQTLVDQYGANWTENPLTTCINPLIPNTADGNTENNSRDVTEDEMREDTEELNALLCSDSDSDFSVDDEETSTGHSPSTMTENGIHYTVDETECGEEVDSLVKPTKRQKLLDGGYVLSDTSSSLEDGAESCCGNGSNTCKEKLKSWSGNKRLRNENIRETLSILQSVIPNMNGKDAIVVIDEAIHYLKSLKVEAMALGLNNI